MANPLYEFARGGPPFSGVPAAVRLNPLGLHFWTLSYRTAVRYYESLTDVLRVYWDQIVQDVTAQLAVLDPGMGFVHGHYAAVFYGPPGSRGPWRSVYMNWNEFSDGADVEDLLDDQRPDSDKDDIDVQWLQIEVILAPAAPLRKFGSWDQKRIERARPMQTKRWYKERQKAGSIVQIKNADNNMCLEFCIAAYQKERKFREEKWARNKDERKEHELEVAGARERKSRRGAHEVIDAENSPETERKLAYYIKRGFNKPARGPEADFYKDAHSLAVRVWGAQEALTRERTLQSVDRYTEKLRVRIQVFQYDESGLQCSLIRQSWAEEDRIREAGGAPLLPPPMSANSPLISVLYTPPPADDLINPVGHFDLIPDRCNVAVKYLGFSSQYLFCNICCRHYERQTPHRCMSHCHVCGHWGCKGFLHAEDRIECKDCGRAFYGEECFDNHRKKLPSRSARPLLQTVDQAQRRINVKAEAGPPLRGKFKEGKWSMCESLMDCAGCGQRGVPRRVQDKKKQWHEHVCGHELCAHCDAFAPKEHECYVQPKEWKKPGQPDDYVCVDIECNTAGVHEPYSIRACHGLGDKKEGPAFLLGGCDREGQPLGVSTPESDWNASQRRVWHWFEGANCADRFVDWLLDLREERGKGFTVLAHNGSGYDYAVLYRAIYTRPGVALRHQIHTTYRGTKLLGIKIGHGKKAIHFRDFLLHVPGKLDDMVKTFGLTAELKASGLWTSKVTKKPQRGLGLAAFV